MPLRQNMAEIDSDLTFFDLMRTALLDVPHQAIEEA